MSFFSEKILIVGSLPPPTGGVTVHTKRLLDHLSEQKVKYDFFQLRASSIFRLILELLRHKVVHIHVSNIPLCFLISVFCFIFRKKLIMTRHGCISRHKKGIVYTLDLLSIFFSWQPIVLNKNSLKLAQKYNAATIMLSSFLPELKSEKLSENIVLDLQRVRKNFKKVYVAVASDFAQDKEGREIYGISELINLFSRNKSLFLVAAIGSRRYRDFLIDLAEIPKNVYLIPQTVPFVDLLNYVDGMIRNTITDGDAVSVREGLFAGIPVFASACVDRPAGTIVYHSLEELEAMLNCQNDKRQSVVADNSLEKIIEIYNIALNKQN